MRNWLVDHRVMSLWHMVDRLSYVRQERVERVWMEGRRREGVATMQQVLMVEDLINMQ